MRRGHLLRNRLAALQEVGQRIVGHGATYIEFRVMPQFEISSRKSGSIQIVSPTLPFTDEISSSAMPTSLKPAITNSRPTRSEERRVGKGCRAVSGSEWYT